MAKGRTKNHRTGAAARASKSKDRTLKRWIPVVAILVVAGIVAVGLMATRANRVAPGTTALAPVPTALAPAPATNPSTNTPATPNPPAEQATPSSELVTMDVAKAVMVTVELDLGKKSPSIAEGLAQVERRYQPDDGQGRTFAVLDAYGETTADGKLHMSMHVSSEKPGGGQLVFKRTGEVLWRGRINPTSQPVQPKNLTILLDNGKGTTLTIDGSNNPNSIIDAKVKPGDLPVKDIWPDGQERELTFVYSACGCPVKVFARRVGDRTMRVSDTPVIFPDDPAAVALIARLMRW
jgi:hypothetical protein